MSYIVRISTDAKSHEAAIKWCLANCGRTWRTRSSKKEICLISFSALAWQDIIKENFAFLKNLPYNIAGYYAFRKKEDAMQFKLRWL